MSTIMNNGLGMRLMNQTRGSVIIILLLAVAVHALYGCDSPAQVVTPAPPTSAPVSLGSINAPAIDLLNKAFDVAKNIKSYHFVVRTDTPKGMLAASEGDFMFPDRQRINLIPGKDSIVLIGKDVFVKHPGSTSYISVPSANPVGGFDPLQRIANIARYIDSAVVLDDETAVVVNTTHIRFTYEANKVLGVPTNLGKAQGDIWIESSTNYVRQMKNSVSNGQQTTLTVYSRYNEPITPPIEKP